MTVTADGPDTAKVFDFAFGIPATTPVTTDSLYASTGAQSVTTGTIIPLAQTAAPAGSGVTVDANAVTVPAGTYLVSFGADGSSAADGALSVQLYANGAPLATEIITDDSTGTAVGNVSKTILYTAAAPTTLSIYNASTDTVNFTDAYITVVRVA